MNAPRVRTHRRTRPTRACPLAVVRYRAAFLVRIPFISVLPSAHGSKWLPGRTRRARTPRRCVVSSRVIEIPCDVGTNERTTANLDDADRLVETLAAVTAAAAAAAAARSLNRSLAPPPRQRRVDVKAYARVHVPRFALLALLPFITTNESFRRG